MPATTSCCPAPLAAGRCAWPSQDGKANAVLLAFLAEVFGSVQLLSGHAAPFKKVEVTGVSDEEGAAVLARYSL